MILGIYVDRIPNNAVRDTIKEETDLLEVSWTISKKTNGIETS